jgi:hypothetical protein
MFASCRPAVLTGFVEPGKTRAMSAREEVMTIHHFVRRGSCVGDGPPVDVAAWRLCRLLEAGFPTDLANRLAAEPGIDVHALLALVDRGCPPELAARILSPVRGPGGRS